MNRRARCPGIGESRVALDGVVGQRAKERKQILAGVPLGDDYPELSDALLVSVTEMNRADEFGRLAAAIAEVR